MSDKIKVIEVLECGGPGGTGNQVAAICNGLDPEKFEVGLAFAARQSDPAEYRALARGAQKAFYVPEMVRNISPAKDWAAFKKLLRIFREEKPDVVHAHSSKAGVLARLAAKIAGAPVIFYSPHGYSFLREDCSWAARIAYWILELCVSRIGEIVAVSPSEAALARPLAWGKQVRMIFDACLTAPPQGPPPKKEGVLFGACGRITAARDPGAFANLCQRLTDARHDIRCVWIGSGEDEGALRENLADMNLERKVEITGWLGSQEAARRLSGLDVMVHYSRWDALPNAVLEAMALGLPVVASAKTGCRDAVVHGETGFLAEDEIELFELCLKLADDPGLRRRMGEAGRARARELFSPEKAFSALAELYRR
ncbi:MAG: glycosyltransferase [Elusimicrobiota bacterium]